MINCKENSVMVLHGWSDTPAYYQLQHELDQQLTSLLISCPNTGDYRALLSVMLQSRHASLPVKNWSLHLDFLSGNSLTVKMSLN
jgi:hypothetical protein